MAFKQRCREAFRNGQRDRRQNPLHSGARVLRETLHRWHQYMDRYQLIVLATTAKREELNPQQRPKLPIGARAWMREFPIAMAHDFGFNVVPAIEALGGDGVLSDRVTELNREAHALAFEIWTFGDRHRLLMHRHSLDHFMRYENGSTNYLFNKAIPLVQRALDVVEAVQQSSWRHPTPQQEA